MATRYFSQFNKIYYDLTEDKSDKRIVTNILQRSSFLKELSGNIGVYYEYEMKDSDTAEIIADKYYGSPHRHWIVLLFNQIIDPYYSFPLAKEELDSFIVKKYGLTSINQALSTIHHYESQTTTINYFNGIEQSRNVFVATVSTDEVNYDTGDLSPRQSLPAVDQTIIFETKNVSFGGGITTKYEYGIKAYSQYAYEDMINEQKRNIKLLKKEYVNKVEEQFTKLMTDNG